MIKLYEDQQRTINFLKQKVASGQKSVLLQGGTGSGKTIMATSILKGADAKGTRTWFVVPRKELLRQVDDTMTNFDLNHGFIASGRGFNQYEQHHICMDKTVTRRLDKVTAPDLMIVDECHFGGETTQRIVDWAKERETLIIGLSATPWKLSGKGLHCMFDDMVCGPSTRWLIDNKRLSEYKIFAPDIPRLTGVRSLGGDYNPADLERAMLEDKARLGNAVEAYREYCQGMRTVVFGVSIKDCGRIAKKLRENNITAEVISGETPDEERARLIMNFAKGYIQCLVNCDLLTFGFDLAAQVGFDVTVDAMIDMAPTKSLAKQLQKWGRVLRMKDYPAIIVDLAGNLFEHDKPCADREWTLEDRIKKKRAAGEQEKTILLRQCLHCGYTFRPAPVCPQCNTEVPVQERKVDEVDGGLVEVDVKSFKKQQRMQVGRAKTMEDLKRIAAERGYKKGWVYHQAKLKGIR